LFVHASIVKGKSKFYKQEQTWSMDQVKKDY
jgi:hypothetical protein